MDDTVAPFDQIEDRGLVGEIAPDDFLALSRSAGRTTQTVMSTAATASSTGSTLARRTQDTVVLAASTSSA